MLQRYVQQLLDARGSKRVCITWHGTKPLDHYFESGKAQLGVPGKDVRFVFPVRNPMMRRASVDSRQLNASGKYNDESGLWRRMMQEACKRDAGVYLISYTDLIEWIGPTTKDLASWLGYEWVWPEEILFNADKRRRDEGIGL